MPDLIVYQSPDDVADLLPAAWYEVAERAPVARRPLRERAPGRPTSSSG